MKGKNKPQSTRTDRRMPIVGHLKELRKTLIISLIALAAGSVTAFCLYDWIIKFLFQPLMVLQQEESGNILYINSLFEGFLIRLKISIFSGAILSSPIHIFNLLGFIFPGLRKKEQRTVIIALLCSFLFIILSFFYSYHKIIPISITFLTGQGFIPDNTGLWLNFGSNIFYILQFMLVTLAVFQIPILLEVLLIMNVLKRRQLIRSGRYVTVGFFILAALLTPPDLVTQISLALPMTALYYLTLLIAGIFRFGED
jgi:sec-independent protein translocase protein TatC